jgi:hypothetical protein
MTSSPKLPSRTPALAALAIAAALHAPALAQTESASPPRIFPIASSGDPAAGLDDAWLTAITSAYLRESGDAAFAANLDGFSLGVLQTGGVWLASPESQRRAIVNGDWIFTSGVQLRSVLGVLGLSSEGKAFVSTTANTWFVDFPGQQLSTLAVREGSDDAMTYPGKSGANNGRLSTLISAVCADTALLLSRGVDYDGGVQGNALLAYFDGWVRPVAIDGFVPLGLWPDVRISSIGSYDISPDNTITVVARISTPQFNNFAVLRGRDYYLDSVVLQAPVVIQRETKVFGLVAFDSIATSSSGRFAVGASAWVNNPQSWTSNEVTAVFNPDASPFYLIARGDTYELDGITQTLEYAPYEFELDASGRLVFVSGAYGYVPVSILTADATGIRVIANEGSAPPGGSTARIERITSASIAPRGDLAWTATVRPAPGQPIEDRLYAYLPGQPARLLLSTGDLVPDTLGPPRPVKSIRLLGAARNEGFISRGSITDSGYILARVGFADGTQTLLLLDTLCPADIDRDRSITFLDFLGFFSAFDQGTWKADLNASGEVDFDDFMIFFNAFDSGCA